MVNMFSLKYVWPTMTRFLVVISLNKSGHFHSHFWNCASLRQFQAALFAYLQVLHLHLNTLFIGADVVVRIAPFPWRWPGPLRKNWTQPKLWQLKHLELHYKHGDIFSNKKVSWSKIVQIQSPGNSSVGDCVDLNHPILSPNLWPRWGLCGFLKFFCV